jgi:hypothetical protein
LKGLGCGRGRFVGLLLLVGLEGLTTKVSGIEL